MITPQERLLCALTVGIFFTFILVLVMQSVNKKTDEMEKEIEDKDGN